MKKTLSVLLAALILLSCCFVGTFSATAAEKGKIYFKLPADWTNTKAVFCHIWEQGGDGFFTWQSKNEVCTNEGDGLWSYDISLLDNQLATLEGGFDSTKTYAVIFCSNIGFQTYDLNLVADCIGDTAQCDGSKVENPVDSAKTCFVARWKTNAKTVHPVVQKNSSGVEIDPDNVGKDNQVPAKKLAEKTPVDTAANDLPFVMLAIAAAFVGIFTIASFKKRA
ncbi:MAG: hypothetical protein LBM65_01940 [Oscillospiraceae bacterium]|jgi:hypothetical protein|nr:hypothetical protein [Oscillospiraceae bacterium]